MSYPAERSPFSDGFSSSVASARRGVRSASLRLASPHAKRAARHPICSDNKGNRAKISRRGDLAISDRAARPYISLRRTLDEVIVLFLFWREPLNPLNAIFVLAQLEASVKEETSLRFE